MKPHRALHMLLEPGGITPVFQPICTVNGLEWTLFGYECLSRGPKGTNFESAGVLFDYVRLKREESLVDRACISAALNAAAQSLPSDTHLSINVHASTLGRDHGFIEFLTTAASGAAIALNRLTVEIVEHAPPWDGVSFLSGLEQLRSMGIKIALDDVGLGQSNFKMLIDVCPNYLKLDRYFVEECVSDPRRQAVIGVISHLATYFGAEVIAEGVHDLATIEQLRDQFGIRLMQGYVFSPPIHVANLHQFATRGSIAATASIAQATG